MYARGHALVGGEGRSRRPPLKQAASIECRLVECRFVECRFVDLSICRFVECQFVDLLSVKAGFSKLCEVNARPYPVFSVSASRVSLPAAGEGGIVVVVGPTSRGMMTVPPQPLLLLLLLHHSGGGRVAGSRLRTLDRRHDSGALDLAGLAQGGDVTRRRAVHARTQLVTLLFFIGMEESQELA